MSQPSSPAPPAIGTPTSAPTDRFIVAVLLYSLLVALALGHQLGSNGMLADEHALWRELHWTEDRPWAMGLDEPFCYRPLFRWIVLGACGLLGDDPSTSYGVFLVLSALSLLAAAAAFDVLLGRVGFESKQRLLGTSLFLLGFPVLFSHDIPVQTREDLLGYAMIAATLVAVADDRPILAGLLGAAGATVRETCLLGVLPLAFISKKKPGDIVPGYFLPFVSLCLVRFAQAPPGPRVSLLELLRSSTLPAREKPLEALVYAFAAFGALWVAAGLRLADPTPPRHPLLGRRVVLLSFAAVVLFGWLFGMVRENRITYVLFPFVVPLALELFTSPRIAMLRRPAAMIAGLAVLAAGAVGIAWLRDDVDRVMQLWPALGDCFNPGVPPQVEVPGEPGEEAKYVNLYFASALQGPVVVMHLALSAALLVGAAAGRLSPEKPAAAA